MTLIEKFQDEASRFLNTRIHNYHVANDGENMFVNSMIVSASDGRLIHQGCVSALTATESFNEDAQTSPFTFECLWLNDSMQVVYQFVYYLEEIDCYFDVIYCEGYLVLDTNYANEDITPESIDDDLVRGMIKKVQVANSFGLLMD
jgi:hypothetical protein